MRVVIDASIDPRLVEAFVGHHVQTLFDLGWQYLKDNVLVKKLDCDVFVTADRGLEPANSADVCNVRQDQAVEAKPHSTYSASQNVKTPGTDCRSLSPPSDPQTTQPLRTVPPNREAFQPTLPPPDPQE